MIAILGTSTFIALNVHIDTTQYSSSSATEHGTSVQYQTTAISPPAGAKVVNENDGESSWLGISTVKERAVYLVSGIVLGVSNVSVWQNTPPQTGYWVETYYAFKVNDSLFGNATAGQILRVGLQGGIGVGPQGTYINLTFDGLVPLTIGKNYVLAIGNYGVLGANAIFPIQNGLVIVQTDSGPNGVSMQGFVKYWSAITSVTSTTSSAVSQTSSIIITTVSYSSQTVSNTNTTKTDTTG